MYIMRSVRHGISLEVKETMSRTALLICAFACLCYGLPMGYDNDATLVDISEGSSDGDVSEVVVKSEGSIYETSGMESSGETLSAELSDLNRKRRDAAEEGSGSESSGAGVSDSEISEKAEEGSGGEEKCESLAECFSHDECNGGQCIGAFVGTCNCNACITGLMCQDDSGCGGLNAACVNGTFTTACDCFSAYTKNGLPSVNDALVSFCNVQTCSPQSAAADCFGLPCTSGLCVC